MRRHLPFDFPASDYQMDQFVRENVFENGRGNLGPVEYVIQEDCAARKWGVTGVTNARHEWPVYEEDFQSIRDRGKQGAPDLFQERRHVRQRKRKVRRPLRLFLQSESFVVIEEHSSFQCREQPLLPSLPPPRSQPSCAPARCLPARDGLSARAPCPLARGSG